MNTRNLRLLAATVVAVCAATLASASPAAAFPVTACRDAPGSANNSWVDSKSSATILTTFNNCGGTGTYAGLGVYENFGGPPHGANGDYAWWTFTAPGGTTITKVAYNRLLHAYADPDWKPELRTGTGTSGAVLESCTFSGSEDECFRGDVGGTQRASFDVSTSALTFGGRCAPDGTNGTDCGRGFSLHSLEAVLYGATVNVRDDQNPTINGTPTTTLPSRWAKPSSGSITVDASDNTGIRERRVVVDGTVRQTELPTVAGGCQTLNGVAYTYTHAAVRWFPWPQWAADDHGEQRAAVGQRDACRPARCG